ncbi:MAG TPA: MFS transporter [Mucilaginibacter sp.]|jgi:ACS family hexuronate transporter-like MFS transporter|nr:MFS transporter [Mucilaginibacter sp.]
MTETKVGNRRWVIVALLFFATTINYLDRQVLSLLKPFIAKDLHWTETDYSHIVMAFTFSYAVGLLLFGNFIDKIGTKIGYTVSLIIWSLSAIGHALVKTVFGFGVARSALGIGEGGNFPAAIKTVAEWFPKKQRALATGIFNSGSNIGAVVAPILVPWLLYSYGWQMAFVATGAIGFIWLIFWLTLYEIPSKHKKLKQAENDFIHSDDNDTPKGAGGDEKVKWVKLLGIRQTWTFVAGKFLTDPIWYFFLFWLPSYFASTFHIDLMKPSPPLVVVYTLASIGSIGGGQLSSWLIKKGWPIFKARKLSMLLFAICVVPVMTARYATNIWQAVGLIALAAAAHQAWSANIFTTASDMFPKKAVSSVVGIGSMAGALGGFFFPGLIGYILDTNKAAGHLVTGYNIIFLICGCAYLLAWIIMHFLSPKMKKVEL